MFDFLPPASHTLPPQSPHTCLSTCPDAVLVLCLDSWFPLSCPSPSACRMKDHQVNAGEADMKPLSRERQWEGIHQNQMGKLAFIRHFLCGRPGSLAAVLVFYCYLTNYHKLSSIKQHLFIRSPFCRSEAQAASFAPVPTKAAVKLQEALGSYLEALGENQLPSSFTLLAESTSMQL